MSFCVILDIHSSNPAEDRCNDSLSWHWKMYHILWERLQASHSYFVGPPLGFDSTHSSWYHFQFMQCHDMSFLSTATLSLCQDLVSVMGNLDHCIVFSSTFQGFSVDLGSGLHAWKWFLMLPEPLSHNFEPSESQHYCPGLCLFHQERGGRKTKISVKPWYFIVSR